MILLAKCVVCSAPALKRVRGADRQNVFFCWAHYQQVEHAAKGETK